MSKPPELPGSQRIRRIAAPRSTKGRAYEGSFEAVGAILVSTGIGYWIDHRHGTSPWGVLIGAVIGFAAFVLRLVRLGRQLSFEDPDASPDASRGGANEGAGNGAEDEHEHEHERDRGDGSPRHEERS